MASLIPQETLDEILQRIDIASLIGDYLVLKKAGKDFKGLCPFHQEKTPSFMVSPSKGIFHCFGCAEGGNAFKFLMKLENLTFPEAAQKLAQRVGIVLKTEEGTSSHHKEKDIFFFRSIFCDYASFNKVICIKCRLFCSSSIFS